MSPVERAAAIVAAYQRFIAGTDRSRNAAVDALVANGIAGNTPDFSSIVDAMIEAAAKSV